MGVKRLPCRCLIDITNRNFQFLTRLLLCFLCFFLTGYGVPLKFLFTEYKMLIISLACREGQADAGALRVFGAPFRHDFLSSVDADAASGGRRVRLQARQERPRRHLLLRRRRRVRGRRACRLQLRRHPRLSYYLLLPQQRLRHQHSHVGTVRWRRHRRKGTRLRSPHDSVFIFVAFKLQGYCPRAEDEAGVHASALR
jgi:hypothetical protein